MGSGVVLILTLLSPQDPGEGSWRQTQGGVGGGGDGGKEGRMKEKRAEVLYIIICQNKLFVFQFVFCVLWKS